MKHLPFLLIAVFPIVSNAQGSITMREKPFKISYTRDTAVLNALKQNAAFTGLTQLEQDVIYWLNIARRDPQAFYKEYVTPFVKQFPEAKGREFNSLARDVKNLKGLPAFEPLALLNKVASEHAHEMVSGKTGFSHSAANGKGFAQRMKEAGIGNCAGENLYEGKNDPLVAVILLLIDKDVNGSGHRKVILHSMLNTVGVSFLPASTGNYILVQDFSCK